MTTLLEFATAERNAYAAAQAVAQANLKAAQAAVTPAQADRDAALAARTASEAAMAAIRAKLGVTPMPADAAELAEELQAQGIAWRGAQADLVAGERAVERAQSEVVGQSALQAAATAKLAQAEPNEEKAKADDEARRDWKEWLKTSTLPADAATYFNDAAGDYKLAVDRVTALLPAELLTRARDRGAQELDRLLAAQAAKQAAEDELVGTQDSTAGAVGAVAKAQLTFDRAARALQDYALNGDVRFELAKTLSEGVLAAAGPSAAETNRMNDPAIVNPGKTAATAQKTRDTRLKAVEDAQVVYDQAILNARAASPDASERELVLTAATEKNALDTARIALDGPVEGARLAREALDAWVATVPAWETFKAAEAARDAAEAVLAATTQALEDAKLKALGDSPGSTEAQIEQKPEVTPAKAAFDAAKAALPLAKTAYTTAKTDLDTWVGDQQTVVDDAVTAATQERDTKKTASDNAETAFDQALTDARAASPGASEEEILQQPDVVIAQKDRDKAADELAAAQAALDTAEANKAAWDAITTPTDLWQALDDAETTEKNAQKDFDDAQAAYEQAISDAWTADLNATPESLLATAAVKMKKTAMVTAKAALGGSEGAYDAVRADLDVWESTVPDSLWRMLADTIDARRILDDLRNDNAGFTDPAAVLSDFATAESDLVTALQDQAKADRATLLLVEITKQRTDVYEAERQKGRERVFSAIRGDD